MKKISMDFSLAMRELMGKLRRYFDQMQAKSGLNAKSPAIWAQTGRLVGMAICWLRCRH
jgi:hypothetical protein